MGGYLHTKFLAKPILGYGSWAKKVNIGCAVQYHLALLITYGLIECGTIDRGFKIPGVILS